MNLAHELHGDCSVLLAGTRWFFWNCPSFRRRYSGDCSDFLVDSNEGSLLHTTNNWRWGLILSPHLIKHLLVRWRTLHAALCKKSLNSAVISVMTIFSSLFSSRYACDKTPAVFCFFNIVMINEKMSYVSEHVQLVFHWCVTTFYQRIISFNAIIFTIAKFDHFWWDRKKGNLKQLCDHSETWKLLRVHSRKKIKFPVLKIFYLSNDGVVSFGQGIVFRNTLLQLFTSKQILYYRILLLWPLDHLMCRWPIWVW